MNKLIVIFFAILLSSSFAYGAEGLTQTPWQQGEQDYAKKGSLDDLREFHEGVVFILKRYATVEALVTARELGKSENESFGIGSASVMPGVGQMLNDDYIQGSILLFATLTSWGTVQHLSFTKKKQTQNQDLLPFYYTALIAKNGLMTYAMLHAGNGQYTMHQDKTAAIWTGMSSLVPGVGQAINGDWWSAAGLFTAWSLATFLTSSLEEKVFINGNENYLVNRPQPSTWGVAILPGGVMLGYSKSF